MSDLRACFRNSLFNSWTQVIGLGGGLIVTALLGRSVGTDGLGVYSFAGGLTSIVVAFTGFGIGMILTREVAKEPQRAREYLITGQSLSLGVCLPLAIVASYILGLALNADPALVTALILFALLQGIRNARGSVFGTLQGLDKFRVVTGAETITQVATIVFGAVVLGSGAGVDGFLVTCVAWEAIFLVALVRYTWQGALPTSNWCMFPLLRSLILAGFPVALTGVANLINLRAGVVMLGALSTREEVGIYTAAFTIYLAAATLLYYFSFGFLPQFSQLSLGSLQRFERLFRTTTQLVGLVALLAAGGLALLAKPIVLGIFGSQFEKATSALVLLSLSVPFIALGRLGGIALTSMGYERVPLYLALTGGVAHVAANLVLIPEFQYVGAAVGNLLGEGLVGTASLVISLTILEKRRRAARGSDSIQAISQS